MGSDGPARFRFHRPQTDALYLEAVQQFSGAMLGARSTFAVLGDAPQQRGVIHIIPVMREARDVFTGATAIMIANLAEGPEALPDEVLQMLFDLTAAEAAVARRLALGLSTAEIAAGAGRSIETIRSQIKTILGKSGLSSRRELTGLLQAFSTRPESGR